MSWSAHDVPRRTSGAELATVGPQSVLLDPSGATARGLNPTAAKVWELIDGQRSLGAIVDALAPHQPVERATLEADVAEFLASLESGGLVVRGGG